jgi:hypothetical protein
MKTQAQICFSLKMTSMSNSALKKLPFSFHSRVATRAQREPALFYGGPERKKKKLSDTSVHLLPLGIQF